MDNSNQKNKEIQNTKTETINTKTNSKKKITSKQVVALGGVILLVLMYLVTLVVAIVDNSSSGKLFSFCMYATIVIPMLIWVYIWLYGRLKERIASTEEEIASDTSDSSSSKH